MQAAALNLFRSVFLRRPAPDSMRTRSLPARRAAALIYAYIIKSWTAPPESRQIQFTVARRAKQNEHRHAERLPSPIRLRRAVKIVAYRRARHRTTAVNTRASGLASLKASQLPQSHLPRRFHQLITKRRSKSTFMPPMLFCGNRFNARHRHYDVIDREKQRHRHASAPKAPRAPSQALPRIPPGRPFQQADRGPDHRQRGEDLQIRLIQPC